MVGSPGVPLVNANAVTGSTVKDEELGGGVGEVLVGLLSELAGVGEGGDVSGLLAGVRGRIRAAKAMPNPQRARQSQAMAPKKGIR
jgi:hypothetical protein